MSHKDFFSDVEALRTREILDEFILMTAAEFFADCDRLTSDQVLTEERELRYRVRRSKNEVTARRIYSRLLKVRRYDPWDKTQNIHPDIFGDKYHRWDAVMSLENKRRRIEWTLWCMYHWYMFDHTAPGVKRYGKRYSMYRALWYRYYELTQERVKQERWDRKREAVRARREKRKKRKSNDKKTVEETLFILKNAKLDVQDVITNAEPISDLPTGSEPITVFVCGSGTGSRDDGMLRE